MSEHEQPEPDAVTKVARDLREIEDLSAQLLTQAVHKANDREMPGGDAMVALAGVANQEAWGNLVDTALRIAYDHGDTLPEIEDEEDFEPPLQTLCFWTEQLRAEHGDDYSQRYTVSSEVNYLRHMLGWMWDNEPHFADFARDIKDARSRLENILSAGRRAQRGVQCFDCRVDLVRPSRDRHEHKHCSGHDGVCGWPHKFCPHDRGGLADEWLCPSCDRRYDVEDYYRAVRHAHLAHADYLQLGECIDRTGATRGSIQGWASKGLVKKRRDQESGRMTYCVADIEARKASESKTSGNAVA